MDLHGFGVGSRVPLEPRKRRGSRFTQVVKGTTSAVNDHQVGGSTGKTLMDRGARTPRPEYVASRSSEAEQTKRPPPNKPHMAWVDLIKATSVLLVVLMHFSLVLGDFVDTDATSFWNTFNVIIEPLRMPIFFVVSGLLAAGAVNRSWDANRKRTLGIGYLFVLWSLVVALTIFVLTPSVSFGDTVTSLTGRLLIPADGYWYLYALVVYFVIAKSVRSWPIWLILGLAAIPNLLRPLTIDSINGAISPFYDPGMISAVAVNLIFFLVGVYAKELIRTISEVARWPFAVGIGAAALALSVVRFQNEETWQDSFLLISALWIVAGIMVATLIAHKPTPARFGAYIGTRTLPIFVLQFPLMYVTGVWFQNAFPSALEQPIVQAAFPIAAVVIVALLALGLFRLANASRFKFLFNAPQWVLQPRLPRSESIARSLRGGADQARGYARGLTMSGAALEVTPGDARAARDSAAIPDLV